MERYKVDPLYRSDRPVDKEEIDVGLWDNPYPFGKGKVMSTAEIAKSIELIDLLRNEVEVVIEEGDLDLGLKGFRKDVNSKLLKGVEIITYSKDNKEGTRYVLRYFKGGTQNRKVVIENIGLQNEETLVILPDGHFSLSKQMTNQNLETLAFSSRPTDIGFERITPEITKRSVSLVKQFLGSGSVRNRPLPPSLN